jgi:16S rRNA (guanine527-N7)-methyltransferase
MTKRQKGAAAAAPYAPTPAETAAEAARAGFELSAPQAEALSRYLTLLLKWSRAMNLVGRTGWPEVFRDLAADSLHLARFLAEAGLPPNPLTLDLGAGAGLPGIPLRVLWPEGEYVLVELREKRAIFLTQAVAAVRLPRTFVLHGRAEGAVQALPGLGLLRPRQGADLVLSRAFMPWPRLLPLAAGLLGPDRAEAGGKLVVLANEAPPAAIGEGLGAGFRLAGAREYPAGGGRRYFWLLELDRV